MFLDIRSTITELQDNHRYTMTSNKNGSVLAKQGKPGIKAKGGLARPGRQGVKNRTQETKLDPTTSTSKRRSDLLLSKVRLVNWHYEKINAGINKILVINKTR